jgi:hypothetical protein
MRRLKFMKLYKGVSVNDTTKTDCGGGCGATTPEEVCPKCGNKKSECAGGGKCGACRTKQNKPTVIPKEFDGLHDVIEGPCSCGAWHKPEEGK